MMALPLAFDTTNTFPAAAVRMTLGNLKSEDNRRDVEAIEKLAPSIWDNIKRCHKSEEGGQLPPEDRGYRSPARPNTSRMSIPDLYTPGQKQHQQFLDFLGDLVHIVRAVRSATDEDLEGDEVSTKEAETGYGATKKLARRLEREATHAFMVAGYLSGAGAGEGAYATAKAQRLADDEAAVRRTMELLAVEAVEAKGVARRQRKDSTSEKGKKTKAMPERARVCVTAVVNAMHRRFDGGFPTISARIVEELLGEHVDPYFAKDVLRDLRGEAEGG
jgi:hypothetical protein